jgi:hypothetical protein
MHRTIQDVHDEKKGEGEMNRQTVKGANGPGAPNQTDRLVQLLDRAHHAIALWRDRADLANLAADRADLAIGELSRALADRNVIKD